MGSMWLDEVIATARLDTLPVQARTRRELARVLADAGAPLGRIAMVVMTAWFLVSERKLILEE